MVNSIENTNTQVLILAGGLGTRLQAISNNIPKSMMPIKGIPFLEYLILHLKKHEFTEIVLCIGHLHEHIEHYFQDGRKWGITVIYSREDSQMGTGGAIKLAENLITSKNFIALNGDSFLNINPHTLLNFHKRKHALLTMALAEIEDTRRYGIVEINTNNRILKFSEKKHESKSSLINAGIYVFNRQIFDYIAPNKNSSLEKEIFPEIPQKRIFGFVSHSYFIDIGSPEDYHRAQMDLPAL